MEKYKAMVDFGGVGAMSLMEAIVSAVPVFFPVMLFVLWIFGTASSYFMILKTTNKKRFWHSLTAMAFIIFLASLLISSMNTVTTTYLSGYWVGFYILMVLGSWFFLDIYK